MSWSDSRIVVEVPARAKTGDVRVVTVRGSSGARRIEVEDQGLEPLPSTGVFGYNPPDLTEHPKSVKFGFEGIGHDLVMTWYLKNDAEVEISVNGQEYGSVPVHTEWQRWFTTLLQRHLTSGQNVIEFRNVPNQDRTSNYTHWQLKDVKLWKPFDAKLVAGARLLSPFSPVLESGLGQPFPTPFNAEVTVPFTTTLPLAKSASPSTTWLDSGSAS